MKIDNGSNIFMYFVDLNGISNLKYSGFNHRNSLSISLYHKALTLFILCLFYMPVSVHALISYEKVPSNLIETEPYKFAGAIRFGWEAVGSGSVARYPNIVISCAHLFGTESKEGWTWYEDVHGTDDDAGDTLFKFYSKLHQQNPPNEEEGIPLRGNYINTSYAQSYVNARLNDEVDKRYSLDFAVYWGYEDMAGGGYAPAYADGKTALKSSNSKLICGYPSTCVTDRFMYRIGPFEPAWSVIFLDWIYHFTATSEPLYLKAWQLEACGGMSGGPVYVLSDSNIWALAGVAVSHASVLPVHTFGAKAISNTEWDLVDSIVEEIPPRWISYPQSSSTGNYTITWHSLGSGVEYELERSSDSGDSWDPIYSGGNTYYPESVENGSYRYRVRNVESDYWRTGEHDCVVIFDSGCDPDDTIIELKIWSLEDTYTDAQWPDTPRGEYSQAFFSTRTSGLHRYAYLYFPISLPSETSILNASISLFVESCIGSGFDSDLGTFKVKVNRVKSAWDEQTLTWNNAPSHVYAQTEYWQYLPDDTTPQRYYEIGAQLLVQGWIDHGNHGVMLSLNENDADWCHVRFLTSEASSYNPYLRIRVRERVTPPTSLSGPNSGREGKSLSFTAHGAKSSLEHPLQYQFDWGDGTVSSWGTASQRKTYNNKGQYQISVRARNRDYPEAYSEWSSVLKTVNITPSEFTILGYVRDSNNDGISGVLVSANNGGGSDTTNSSGYYSLSVPYGWSGEVTPEKPGHDFSPESQSYSNITSNQTNQDYQGTSFYQSGAGTETDPFQISTAAQLQNIVDRLVDHDKHFTLANDIDFGGDKITPTPSFGGVFDGNGYVLSNFVINQPDDDYVGLFAELGSDGQLINVVLEDIEVIGSDYVGGMVGINHGTISDSSVIGHVEGNHSIGGLCGRNSGTISQSYYSGKLEGNERLGGLVGSNWSQGTISESYVSGDVEGNKRIGGLCGYNSGTISQSYATGTIVGEHRLGGLCGTNYGTISESYALGDVNGHSSIGGICGRNTGIISLSYATGDVEGNHSIGGLCGSNSGTISLSFATGTIVGERWLGGLVGSNWSQGTISESYATGDVEGNDDIGGLCGRNYQGRIIHSYSIGKTISRGRYGGLVGTADDGGDYEDTWNFWDIETSGLENSAMGIGKDTDSMKSKSTFVDAGWDFGDNGDTAVWQMPSQWYPALAWQEVLWVPEVTDLAESEAENTVDEAGLRLGSVIYSASHEVEKGYVISQYPYAGNEIPIQIAINLMVSTGPPYSGGYGDETDPYQISSVDDWLELIDTPDDWDKHFILMNDINFEGAEITPVAPSLSSDPLWAAGFEGISFTGVLDGSGYVLKDFVIYQPDNNCVGLFGSLGEGGKIQNLGIENADVTGYSIVGALLGQNGDRRTAGGTISQCYVIGSVTSVQDVDEWPYSEYTGGLCGLNAGIITQSYADAQVYGGINVGGLCGYNSHYGKINQSYAKGSIDGYDYIGGLCGSNNGKIIQSYSSAKVFDTEDDLQGGLCGVNNGTIADSFWNVDDSEQVASSGGWGLTSQEMKQASSFLGWTDGNWTIKEGEDMPRLVWENTGGSAISTEYPPRTYAGSGTEEEPYQITSAADFQSLSRRSVDWDSHFVLMNDIDFEGTVFTHPIVAGGGGVFEGVFDGNGYVVRNFVINQPESFNIGMFGIIGHEGQVINLGLEDIEVVGRHVVGGLSGINLGHIEQSYIIGNIFGQFTVGGLCGGNYGRISKSYVVANTEGDSGVGGLCGLNRGVIRHSYSNGTVTGWSHVGGLCGVFQDFRPDSPTKIYKSYTIASVSGEYVTGGLIGGVRYAQGTMIKLSDCFWDIYVTGQTDGVGRHEISDTDFEENIFGKTTTEMQAKAMFSDAGWDFANTWAICEGTNYPRLQWQILPADFVCPDGVHFGDFAVLAADWRDEKLTYDLAPDTGDGIVNFLDWAVFATEWNADMGSLSDFTDQWLETGGTADIAPAPDGDGIVDIFDLIMFSEYWLEGVSAN